MNTSPIFNASPKAFARLFPGQRIRPVEASDMAAARAHLDSLTKPVGSLGRLEHLTARLWAMSQGRPITVEPGLMLTVAADHGIAARGVSPFPQAVTRQMVANFLTQGAAISVLCLTNGLALRVVDAGCAGGPFAAHPLLLDRRQGDGTADMSLGPAMSVASCEAALRAGFALAQDAHVEGFRTLGLGEMGIGNSTAATALYCAFLGLKPKDVAGPGAGAAPAMVARKAQLVEQALKVNARAIAQGPLETLASVGGFEIAVMAGAMLGAAANGMVILVDGFISTSALAAALAIEPDAAGYAVLTHVSAEPGYAAAVESLAASASANAGLDDWACPLLQLGLRLGEGTGAALAWPLVRSAAAIGNEMATLAAAGVSATEADRIA